MIAGYQVERGARFRLVLVVPARVIPAATALDLFRVQAEQEKVFLAGRLGHFDGRTIARAAGFVAGGGDLLEYVARRDEIFRDCCGKTNVLNDFGGSCTLRLPFDLMISHFTNLKCGGGVIYERMSFPAIWLAVGVQSHNFRKKLHRPPQPRWCAGIELRPPKPTPCRFHEPPRPNWRAAIQWQ